MDYRSQDDWFYTPGPAAVVQRADNGACSTTYKSLSSGVIVYKTYCAIQWIDIWIATSRTNGTNMVPFFVFFWQQAASHSLWTDKSRELSGSQLCHLSSTKSFCEFFNFEPDVVLATQDQLIKSWYLNKVTSPNRFSVYENAGIYEMLLVNAFQVGCSKSELSMSACDLLPNVSSWNFIPKKSPIYDVGRSWCFQFSLYENHFVWKILVMHRIVAQLQTDIASRPIVVTKSN